MEKTCNNCKYGDHELLFCTNPNLKGVAYGLFPYCWTEHDKSIATTFVTSQDHIDKDRLDDIAFNYYCGDCNYCKEKNATTRDERYKACQESECPVKDIQWHKINGFKDGYKISLIKNI